MRPPMRDFVTLGVIITIASSWWISDSRCVEYQCVHYTLSSNEYCFWHYHRKYRTTSTAVNQYEKGQRNSHDCISKHLEEIRMQSVPQLPAGHTCESHHPTRWSRDDSQLVPSGPFPGEKLEPQ